MTCLSPIILRRTLIAAFVAIALDGCDGEGAEQGAEGVTPPKVDEAKSEAPGSVNPKPSPATQASALLSPKPDIVLSNDTSGLVNIAYGKVATQSGDFTGTSKANLAVDGNVDGEFGHGSVTHTSADPNAWLDIDLENSEALDHIVLWNRTDCCGDRLVNYWIFISDKPFSTTDTADKLKKSKGVTAIRGEVANPSYTTQRGLGRGRYVRIQLDETGRPTDGIYLNLAEVEVYRAK